MQPRLSSHARVALDAFELLLTPAGTYPEPPPSEAWRDGLPPANLSTTVPGIFAAGDIRSGSMKRVASASGEGASVVSLVHDWLA